MEKVLFDEESVMEREKDVFSLNTSSLCRNDGSRW